MMTDETSSFSLPAIPVGSHVAVSAKRPMAPSIIARTAGRLKKPLLKLVQSSGE